MGNYESLIMESLSGITPKDKYENLKQLISDRNMYQVLVDGLYGDIISPETNGIYQLRDLKSLIETHHERLHKQ